MRAQTFAAVALLLLPVASAADEAYRGPIVDVHLHGFPEDAELPDAPNPVTKRTAHLGNGAAHREATLAEMKRNRIVLGFVSSSSRGPREAAIAWQTAHPERIRASVRIDGSAATPIPDLAELRAAFAAGKYHALGELGLQYQGLRLDDPSFEPLLALAEELDIPVGVHTGLSFPGTPYEPCCRSFRTSHGNPLTLEEALVRHPRLRVYMMHAGGPWLQETIAILAVYPQVYVDVAVVDWIIPREEFHDHLRALVRAGFADRLMFGSDQMLWPEAVSLAVEGVNSASFLTWEQKRAIFCTNAVRFFRLPASTCAPAPE
jgi:hypothetical protein